VGERRLCCVEISDVERKASLLHVDRIATEHPDLWLAFMRV
jgi:hypothetical protein